MCIFSRIDRKDIYRVAEIGEKALPIYYEVYHLLEILHDKEYIVYKCVLDNIIIGFIVLKLYEDKHIHIMSIAISKNYRNKGIGTKFLNFLKNEFEEYRITLYVQVKNEVAVHFYMKNGFQVKNTLDNYYDDLEDKEAYYCEYKKHK